MAVLLFAFSPTVLAHGRFVTTDMGAAVGVAAFVFVVWPVYILNTYHYPPQRQLTDTKSILASYPDSILKHAIIWTADKPLIRAAGHWGLGLAMVQQRSAGGNTIYWMGQVVNTGGPAYFPTVYFLKEPLAWWVLFAMALTTVAFHRRRWPRRFGRGADPKASAWSRHAEEWVWLLWLGIYWTVSMRSELNIGVRHLLPVYPFTIMLVAGRLSVLADWLRTHDPARLRWLLVVIAILFGWYTFESVRVWPSYLTYFNQLAGGPGGGYRYVVDSNLDWGQDAKRLGQWAGENNVPKICVDYFGWADPAYYLEKRYVWTSVTQWKDLNDFRRNNHCNGWLAISVSFFQNANGQRTSPSQNPANYRWLLDTPPATVIGNSIFIWHITAPR
jgi:hypothetical protein